VLYALQNETSFGDALEQGGEGFDLAELLNLLMSHHAITDLYD
jgi:hypothetical protein